MKKSIIKLLLISLILSGCDCSKDYSLEFEVIEISKDDLLKVENDSIYILIPSNACFECNRVSIQLMELYGDHPDYQIIIYGNVESRNAEILFKSNVDKYSNISFDKSDKWGNYFSQDPRSIWVIFSSWEKRMRYRLRLDEENIFVLEQKSKN